jgi:Carboxypeptidase regulatory-like domain
VKPQYKTTAMIFALASSYMAIVMYVIIQNGDGPLPSWFPWFCISYMLGSMLAAEAYSRRVHRNDKPIKINPMAKRAIMGHAGYIVAVQLGLFLWGAYKTFSGQLDWHRSAPAGAFFLALITLLSRSIYKISKIPTQDTNAISIPAFHAQMSGHVRHSDGSSMPNVGVILIDANGYNTARTDASGKFKFDDLKPGDYVVGINLPGAPAWKYDCGAGASEIPPASLYYNGVTERSDALVIKLATDEKRHDIDFIAPPQ